MKDFQFFKLFKKTSIYSIENKNRSFQKENVKKTVSQYSYHAKSTAPLQLLRVESSSTAQNNGLMKSKNHFHADENCFFLAIWKQFLFSQVDRICHGHFKNYLVKMIVVVLECWDDLLLLCLMVQAYK